MQQTTRSINTGVRFTVEHLDTTINNMHRCRRVLVLGGDILLTAFSLPASVHSLLNSLPMTNMEATIAESVGFVVLFGISILVLADLSPQDGSWNFSFKKIDNRGSLVNKTFNLVMPVDEAVVALATHTEDLRVRIAKVALSDQVNKL
jgi:hypothetical protein